MTGNKEEFISILESIKDKVIVTGSYAYGEQTSLSDIDFYIKELPEDQIDYENHTETYCHELINYFESLGYNWESCFIESFSIEDTYIPIEFSAFYNIEEETFEIDILGVKMKAAKSTYTDHKYINGRKRSRVKL